MALGQNALNLLVGCPIPSELLPITLADIHPPMDIVAGIPSDVLLRRPDVLQAEGMLKAANADDTRYPAKLGREIPRQRIEQRIFAQFGGKDRLLRFCSRLAHWQSSAAARPSRSASRLR